LQSTLKLAVLPAWLQCRRAISLVIHGVKFLQMTCSDSGRMFQASNGSMLSKPHPPIVTVQ